MCGTLEAKLTFRGSSTGHLPMKLQEEAMGGSAQEQRASAGAALEAASSASGFLG